jgi:4-hydroxy-tetrahydrodipicolinate synthase
MARPWSGVFPALTTKFKEDGSLDISAMQRHYSLQLDAGVNGLIVLGSLGENSSLTFEEKQEVLKAAVGVSSGRVPVLAGVAEATTSGSCRFVENAVKHGVDGFMLLPPTTYRADKHETLHHLRTVARSSGRPIMIYNNPVAYPVDVTPDMFMELAEDPTFIALKESSENPRRITDIINLVGNRYQIFVGIDDLVFESLMLGAVGWVAGLVCAFPKESVALFRLVKTGRYEEARQLYRWFMPLLHLDASPKFVQYIKLAEALAGVGTEFVREPRLQVVGEERRRIEGIIMHAIETRPQLPHV